jgi:hypothetical protein
LKDNEEQETDQRKKTKTRKKLLLKNLLGLKRISFSIAFDKIREFYDVNLNDLWSVTDNSNGWSLSTIRNKLVHGETFVAPSNHEHLRVAKEHLTWTLERLILGVLGLGIEKSAVSSTKLNHMTAYEDWEKSKNFFS